MIHNYHLEVECPLLDSKLKKRLEGLSDGEITINENIYEISEQIEDIQNDKDVNKQSSKKKSKIEGKSKSKLIKSEENTNSPDSEIKKKKPKSQNKKEQMWQAELESDNLFAEIMKSDREIKGSSHFSSVRKPWGKLISFPEPAIEIPVLNITDLILLRDVFRTELVVRIIHTKVSTVKYYNHNCFIIMNVY